MPAGSVSPVSSVAEALDHWRAGDRVDLLRSELLDVLAAVRDPRDPRGRRYPLAALLAIAILATAAGMRGYAGFATWASTVPEDVLSQLGIRFRRPSEKTFRSALQRLDPADLDRQLGAYFTAVAAAQATQSGLLAVALDGKTLRGARRAGAAAAHLVSVFAHHARLVLGQLAVAEKSNEIPCVRKLLKLFRQVRLLVTVDAMHTQTATAKLICSTLKSHYLMIVKSNQPTLLARIQALPWAEVPVTATDDDHGHGRIERVALALPAYFSSKTRSVTGRVIRTVSPLAISTIRSRPVVEWPVERMENRSRAWARNAGKPTRDGCPESASDEQGHGDQRVGAVESVRALVNARGAGVGQAVVEGVVNYP